MWVLQIDDDEDDLELFAEAIQLFDPRVKYYGVKTIEAALAKFAGDDAAIPDVIFLDINMPQHSGFDCYAILKKDVRFVKTQFVFLSTTINEKEIPPGAAFMEKQHSLKTYVASLQNVLRQPNKGTWYTNSSNEIGQCIQARYLLHSV